MKRYIPEEPTILQIIHFVEWKEIKRAIKYHYPNDKNDYEKLFKYLKTFRKRKLKDINEKIEIPALNTAMYYKNKNLWEEYYDITTNKYSLSFRKWRELANIPISKKTIKYHTLSEIIAHFIWEITFYGNEKKSMKTSEEIGKGVEEVKKLLK